MSRTFLYARVSTADQTNDNQLVEARAAGFSIHPRHTVAETISGSVPAAERPGFSKLLDRLDDGDTLVVTKLDRLGRNTTDVLATYDPSGPEALSETVPIRAPTGSRRSPSTSSASHQWSQR